VVIVQDDRFDGTDSITICATTTHPAEAPRWLMLPESPWPPNWTGFGGGGSTSTWAQPGSVEAGPTANILE
jgi:hypothetical protein